MRLLQSDLQDGSGYGYDHHIIGSKKRHNPVDFTGCLAHAKVTYLDVMQKIL
jgi:hypothetical protein